MAMRKINIPIQDWRRDVAKEAWLVLQNRFLEGNPALSDESPAAIQRPGMLYWQTVGNGPIRRIYMQPGTFDDDLFVVSYDALYRVDRATGSATSLTSGLNGATTNGAINFATTGDIGDITPRLFFCDGTALYVYSENSKSRNTLQRSGAISNGEQVVIDGVYYQWTTGSLESGPPDGTSGTPWLVDIGASDAASLENMALAIGANGTAGTTYSTDLTAHTTVEVAGYTATDIYIQAIVEGSAGDGLACTETMANGAWDNTATANGGTAIVQQVYMPDGVGVIDVASINNYIVVIPVQGAGLNGRYYWINPGEIVVDSLSYATAERSPDPVLDVEVFNDQVWFMGQNTTEIWYPSGDQDAPFTRLQGVVFDRGVIQGTALQVKGSVILVDATFGVFQLKGGEKRISTPQIEERIRKALNGINITN